MDEDEITSGRVNRIGFRGGESGQHALVSALGESQVMVSNSEALLSLDLFHCKATVSLGCGYYRHQEHGENTGWRASWVRARDFFAMKHDSNSASSPMDDY